MKRYEMKCQRDWFRVVRCGLAVVGLAALVVGCGSRGTTPVPVTGQVTYNGVPVEAWVTFVGVDDKTRPASGRSDANGHFSLGTLSSGDGAFPGEYRVSVSPSDPPPMPGEGVIYKSPLPERYDSPDSSGLVVTIENSRKNHFTFDLTDE